MNRAIANNVGENFAPTFTAAAKVTGQTERLVELNAETGKKIADDVLAYIQGTELDTGMVS